MNLKITSKNGVILHTAETYCDEDINITLDNSLFAADTSVEDSLIDGTVTTYTNDRVTFVKNSFFAHCYKLVSIDLPEATYIGSSCFYGCTLLTDVNLPKVEKIDAYSFRNCDSLTKLSFPALTNLLSLSCFYTVQKLDTIDLGLVTHIPAQTFEGCNRLKNVILRSSTLVSLANVNAFNKCYFFQGTVNATINPEGLKSGSIYVPDDLVESYKAATNWSTYAECIKPLSEYVEV